MHLSALMRDWISEMLCSVILTVYEMSNGSAILTTIFSLLFSNPIKYSLNSNDSTKVSRSYAVIPLISAAVLSKNNLKHTKKLMGSEIKHSCSDWITKVSELDLTVEFKREVGSVALSANFNVFIHFFLTVFTKFVNYSVFMDFQNVNTVLWKKYHKVLTFVLDGSSS